MTVAAGNGETTLPAVLVAGFAGALGAGLREVIARDGELRVVGREGEGDISMLVAEHRPAAALLNDDTLGGAIELHELVVSHPDTGIVVAVAHLRPGRDRSLLTAGARVVVPITTEASELRVALRLVARGLVGPPRPARGAGADDFGSLTPREMQVLELLVGRLRAREIAEALKVTEATVNTHRRRIYEKLGVHSRAELAARTAELRGTESELAVAPVLPRERVAFRSRSCGARNWERPSPVDMRYALGVSRWRRRT